MSVVGFPGKDVDTVEAAGSPLRLTDAGLTTIIDQFQDSPLLKSGAINVVGLEAIAERLGRRWAIRQDLVLEHAEAVLRRQLGPTSVIQRISGTEYIVAQPDASRFSGQLSCLNALREILQHFLGDALVGDLRVHEVTQITKTGVLGRRLDVAAIEAVDAVEASQAKPISPPADEPPRRSLDRWTPFVSTTGRRIGVSCSLEPVVQLKSSVSIGYRVTRRVLQLPSYAPLSTREFETLAPADVEKIDLASIARGIDRVRNLVGRDKPLSMVLSISYTTLQSRRARPGLLGLLGHARAAVQHGLIVEIAGIDGAPASALPEAISVVRPFCLHVIGRLSDGLDQNVRFLRGAGLTGLSVRCPPMDGDAQFIGWAKSLAAAASRVARTLFIYNVDGIARAKLGATLGVTHATLAPQRLKSPRTDDEMPSGVFRPLAKSPFG